MSQLDATHHLSVVQSDAHPDDRELKGKRAATRHRLMNACETIIVDSGFRAVSMTAIAEQAGITRQTVYRYFANSREAIEATLLRAGREVLEAQCLVLRERGEPRDLIVTAVITSLRLINHNMLLVKALNSDGNPKALFSATLSSDLAVRSAEELKRIGDRVGWDEQECSEVSEVITRCVNSYLMMPPRERAEAAIRDTLYKRLIPALGL
ncbi:MAG: TetR/AcrR family transcriptional regulator [Deltaproteobacteria bacterium]|nr:TetR/AcrR family transcriptional regulator [Deltaproteobacteria bacterium]